MLDEKEQIPEVINQLAKEQNAKIQNVTKNKDDEEIYVLKKEEFEKKSIPQSPVYTNKIEYLLYNKSGKYIGMLGSAIEGSLNPDTVELTYKISEDERKKGNASIAVKTAVSDIFSGSMDGLQVWENGNKSKIENIFLDIVDSNIPSQKVAEKNGFANDKLTGSKQIYSITKKQYEEMIHKNNKNQDMDEER